MVKYGLLHNHTENSVFDSAQTADMLCKTAKKLGAHAVALTDHGTLMGIMMFIDACKKYDIKPILGCEAYYQSFMKSHLILMAKNYTGYQAIMKAISEANHNIDNRGAPLITKENLIKYFGVGGIGHDNVIATSACMQGVLSVIYLQNFFKDRQIEKLHKKNSNLPNPTDPSFLMMVQEKEEREQRLEQMEEQYKHAQLLAGKKYTARKKSAIKRGDTEEVAQIEVEEAETEQAKKDVIEMRKIKSKFSKKLTLLKDEIKKLEEKHSRYYANCEEIESLENTKKSSEEINTELHDELNFFKEVFGEDNFYIELQNHRIPAEIEVYPALAKLAKETNTPVVIANDAHMPDSSPESIRARQIMRSLRFNTFEETQEADKELYLKTDEELTAIISEIISPEIVEEGLKNIGKIVDACNVEFPNASNYPVYHDPQGRTSKVCLEEMARKGISWRFPNGEWNEKYEERLKYELGIIDKLGFNDYLLIVEDFLRYGRLLGQLDKLPEHAPTMEELEAMPKDFATGVGIGPGRGSAVGSLVCYLTGITSQDPLKYHLFFERFLNAERVTMPDIDSDFRPDIRELVVEYCEHKYGEKAVCGIMARSTQQAKAAIRNCARIYGSQLFNDTRTFLSLGDDICSSIDEELTDFSEISKDLEEKFASNEDALQIIKDAGLVYGTLTGITKHAAGIVISGCPDVTDFIPTLYIPGKDAFATQFDKVYVEDLGCLKMDFLGLNNLHFINDALKMIRDNHGDTFDVERLPFTKKCFAKIFASGNTTAVFQFESSGMKQMLREFRPDCFEDLILLVAAYRPGPLQYLPDIIAVKKKQKKPSYIIPEMEEVLGSTYGSPIYQEQIMQIFNKFAGFSLGEADIIRRLMSKKKTEEFAKYKDRFIEGLIERGADPEGAEDFWSQLIEFSKYAFNKSHATAYAYVSYITGYLKCYYPAEYMCAVMNNIAFEKLTNVLGDCKQFNIKVLPPDINLSEDGFSIKNGAILCGFGTIKGVASAGADIQKERAVNGPFTSFANFYLRCRSNKSAIESLVYSGAFDEFTTNRGALVEAFESFSSVLDKIKDREKKLENIALQLTDNELIRVELEKKAEEKAIKSGTSPKKVTPSMIEKERESLLVKQEKYTISLNEYIDKLYAVPINNTEESSRVRLEREKEVLGAYISASPLDGYQTPREAKCTPIAELADGRDKFVMGFISDLRLTRRKSDGAEMAFFNLEDNSGIISVNVFTKAFEENRKEIVEGNVVKIKGSVRTETFNEETKLKLNSEKIETLKPLRKPITIFVKHIGDWTDNVYPQIRPYCIARDGYPLRIYDMATGQFRNCKNLMVSKSILEDDKFKTQF